jgi:hypothetical protein
MVLDGERIAKGQITPKGISPGKTPKIDKVSSRDNVQQQKQT